MLQESRADTAARPERVASKAAGLILSAVMVLVLVMVGLAVGTKYIPLDTVGKALLNPDGGPDSIIVWQLRMPRTALGVLVGVDLALAGVVMQALTRNRLAEPGILGVNSGAAFAVVLAISIFGITGFFGYVWFAVAGSAIAAVAVHALGERGREHSRTRLVLAGAALSASLGACTGIVTMFDATAFDSYRFWVVGALADRGVEVLAGIAPFSVAGVLLALALGPRLNVLALGDELGAALGLRVFWVRVLGFTAVMLLAGAATAAAGPIAFVGLVVPHVLRLLIGPDVRWLLAHALAAGPILVLAADVAGRVVTRPSEVELGIVTAFIGAPFLLGLIVRRRGAGT